MKKRWKRNENGSTLVELMTAFLILLLVAEAMLLSVSGYSKTVKRYREIYEAGNRLERHMGDAEYGDRQRSIWRLMEKNFWNRDISRKKRRIPEPSRSRDSGCP